MKKSVCFTMKVYIINNFKINIFINTNIITLQKIISNLKIRIVKLEKCQKLIIFIDVVARTLLFIKKIIRTKTFITITFNNIIKVFIVYNDNIFEDRNFLFEFNYI